MTPAPTSPDEGAPLLKLIGPDPSAPVPHQAEWRIGGQTLRLSFWTMEQWSRLDGSLQPDDAQPVGLIGWAVLRTRD